MELLKYKSQTVLEYYELALLIDQKNEIIWTMISEFSAAQAKNYNNISVSTEAQTMTVSEQESEILTSPREKPILRRKKPWKELFPRFTAFWKSDDRNRAIFLLICIFVAFFVMIQELKS